MSAILDAFPYPWSNPAAQQLHVLLGQLFPRALDAVNLAQKAGLDAGFINREQATNYVWIEVLDQAASNGVTRVLVENVVAGMNPANPRRAFFETLLADKTPPTEGEPRLQDGAPLFLSQGGDDVSEQEALLYRDDLTIQIGKVPALVETLRRLFELAPAVCKLDVDVNGLPMVGTGFRIGPDLLLTNWHVLHHPKTGARATAVTAQFGYEDRPAGAAAAVTAIPCDVNSIVTSREDDWGVIRAAAPLSTDWPVVKLSEGAAPQVGAAAYIIQHPGGTPKRLGFVRNQVSFFDDRVVHYLTDTQAGSSGAPVFDEAGRLIALHHMGGRPQEVTGRPPLKKNEGIRISRVREGLAAANVVTP